MAMPDCVVRKLRLAAGVCFRDEDDRARMRVHDAQGELRIDRLVAARQTERAALRLDLAERRQVAEDVVVGFARQLREQMGGLLNNLQLLSQDLSGTGSPTDRRLASINRNFYQMLRLVNNLEFLRDTKSQSGVAFSPVTMDLAGLCRHTAEDTAPLLAQAGIQLRYQSSTEGLLIPGDAALLSRMLLGLLSNAAKAAPSGTVLLTLRRWGDRAVLTCTNSGSTPDDGQLSALLEGASPHLLPEPGEGEGA